MKKNSQHADLRKKAEKILGERGLINEALYKESLKRLIEELNINRLELNNAQFAAIVEFSDDGIESMDLEGNILSWNKGAEKIYGYTAAEMVGNNAVDLYPSDNKRELKNILKKIKTGEAVHHFETSRLRKDGLKIYVSISFSPIKNSLGEILCISVITRDITEQNKNRKALSESELKYHTISK